MGQCKQFIQPILLVPDCCIIVDLFFFSSFDKVFILLLTSSLVLLHMNVISNCFIPFAVWLSTT
ncbi:unnamed protein product [Spirodela intermedia]|uniref:Uncharacterized protein n=1 Tax=Spirodela intermedia TaxID=51605 RepID=A0A7I8JEJ9_SPIIN|nr:unnamed protein product [Spirodela intermedia]CAA6668584.1 unnamed protein product [Spirodela intermedia]